MRHFRDRLRREGITVHYHQMTEDGRDERGEDFAAVLRQDVGRLRPQLLIRVRPGDYRVLRSLEKGARALGLPLELRQDSHFYSTVDEFLAFAEGKKGLLLEGFYLFMRRKHRILLSPDGKPLGERWNFDKENRSRLRLPAAG
jgi:deoxyribodipyrimidine photolyase-related protein